MPQLGGGDGTSGNLAQIDDLEDFLENIERQAIMQALEETRWNRTAAAQRLGLSFRSMRYRLKKLGITKKIDKVSFTTKRHARPVKFHALPKMARFIRSQLPRPRHVPVS